MKKQLIVIGLLLVSATTFAQKKEIKTAQKSIKSGNFTEAITTLASIEGLVDKADSSIKEQYSLILAQAYLGAANNDFEKLNLAANLFEKVLLNKSSKYAADANKGLEETNIALRNSAALDQKSKNYLEGSKKIYRSYKINNKDTLNLYFAAILAQMAKDYNTSIIHYEELMSIGYTGITEEFYATKKDTKEETKFPSKVNRDFNIKSGEFFMPKNKYTKSKKGEILKNMILIYLEKGEKEKAKGLFKMAKIELPNDKDLMIREAEMYYLSDDMMSYKIIINKLIKSDPNNSELYFNLGVASNKNSEKEKAMEYYSMAIELNPDYAEALINKAQLILDGERTIIDEMNSLGTSNADYDRYDVLKEQKNKLYLEALPYLESASRLRPESMDIVKTLKGIYGLLGMDTKEKEMRIILDQN
jgi:tetratricopeptide (TPR) repeat protein